MTRNKASNVRIRSARKGSKASAIMFPTDVPRDDLDILERMDHQDVEDSHRQMEGQDSTVRPELVGEVSSSPTPILTWDEWNAASDEDRAAHSAALEARADRHGFCKAVSLTESNRR